MLDSIRAWSTWQRWVLWFAIMYAIGFVLSLALSLMFHPPLWVLWVSCGALGFVWPTPRWVRGRPS